MLELKPLRQDQYKQVAEWEFKQLDGVDWDRYAADMNAPQWAHLAVYDGDSFVACISIETISRNMAAYHVVSGRHKVHPRALADACIRVARSLFLQGCVAVVAHNPVDKRAGARLAIRCGMREWGRTPTTRFFMITRTRFIKNGRLETKTCPNAI